MTSNTVVADIAHFFPATIELATVAIVVATVVGVPLGVWAAVRQGTRTDHVVRVFCLTGQSVPLPSGFAVTADLLCDARMGARDRAAGRDI